MFQPRSQALSRQGKETEPRDELVVILGNCGSASVFAFDDVVDVQSLATTSTNRLQSYSVKIVLLFGELCSTSSETLHERGKESFTIKQHLDHKLGNTSTNICSIYLPTF